MFQKNIMEARILVEILTTSYMHKVIKRYIYVGKTITCSCVAVIYIR